jgi:alpha-tubulin suppressor-like RCC1 family protein
MMPNLSSIKAVAAGCAAPTAYTPIYSWGMALTTGGAVWGWGTSVWLPPGTSTATSPVLISGLSNIIAISAGSSFGLAVDSDGSVWGFGTTAYGELGIVDGNFHAPFKLTTLSSVAAVAAGQNHGLALRTDGTVWAWGSNLSGELGNGSTSQTGTTTPAQVPGLSASALKISAGGHSSLAVFQDGTLWTWGDNTVGQLANGSTGLIFSPVPISQ